MIVEATSAEVTFPLRHVVLGRGSHPDDLARPDDADPATGHFVVREDGEVVGTGTVRRQQPPFASPSPGWQIRGMAVPEERRGRGIGTAILRAILDHVAANGGGTIWCNARIGALTLYERAGFEPRGPMVDDPVAGPQVLMARVL